MKKLIYSTRSGLFGLMTLVLALCLCGNADAQNADVRPVTQHAKLKELSRFFSQQLQARRTQLYYDLLKSDDLPQRLLNEDSDIQLMYIDEIGHPVYYSMDNLNAARTISTDDVWPGGSGGFSLSGSGTALGELGVWDGRGVRTTHQEFGGRVTQMDSPSGTHYHSTHVAGTMVAEGVNSLAKGMSFEAMLAAYDWTNDNSEMASAASSGMNVSNHSYGRTAGWYDADTAWFWFGNIGISYTEDYKFGFYDLTARAWDSIACDAPYYTIVKAAGNDRNDNLPASVDSHFVWQNGQWEWSTDDRDPDGGADGYDCIPTYGTAKNIITVGAVHDIPGGYTDPSDVVMGDFSGWGPADDGRIKPDLVANGISLYSCTDASNSSYGSYSGTSMAAPSVSGSLNLLVRHYEATHGGLTPLSSTMKAIVIQTADEAGPDPGPDYMFGWGLINTLKAAELIEADAQDPGLITEQSLVNGETDEYSLYSNGTEPIRITLAWTDPPGTPPAVSLNPTTPMLVNDLDLRLEHVSTSTIYRPYVLDPDNPDNPADTSDNVLDNVEQVFVDSPPAGDYRVTVSHKGVLATTQFYSLVSSGGDGGSQDSCDLLYVLTGEAAGDMFGYSVSGAGDVNNDGFADLIVGARNNNAGGNNAGRAYVYSGQTGALLWTFTGEAAEDWFGFSVSGARDINNDGYADLIVGACYNDAGGTDAGRAYVYSGQTGALLWTFTGEATGDFFGVSVSGAGDVNDDGFDDLIVGAFYNDVGGNNAGRAYVYSGQTGALLWTFTGEAAEDWFGFSVSGARDVNNDGYADLIVGAFYNDVGGNNAGRAYVYSGQTGALLWTFTGEAADDAFGYSVSGAGDVNNDCFADLIVGARNNNAGGTDAGRAYVYSGQTGALLWTFTGEAADDRFGCSVSGAGDVNNDGFADLIVGAPNNDAGGTDAGRAYVFTCGEGEPYTCGDANEDGVIDLGDILYLISYLYKSGPAPNPLEAGDVTCDETIDLADVLYLISYLYKGGPAPCEGCPGKAGEFSANTHRLSCCLGHAEISLLLKSDPADENLTGFAKVSSEDFDEVSEISVIGKFDRDVAGVHLEIEFNPDEVTLLDPALTPMTKGLQLFSGTEDGTQKIGMVDLSGEEFLPAGEGCLVNLKAEGEDLTSIKIKKAIVFGMDGVPLELELSPELNLETVKASESTPQHFSLSQNYPNPFNPQTSIRYALPQDAQVRLVIYNVLGQRVKTLVDEFQSAGYKIEWWDGRDEKGDGVASGVYFYRLEADKFSEVKKMLLVK